MNAAREEEHLIYGGRGENLNKTEFLIRNHRGQKEVAQNFSGAERKEPSPQNSISSENILQE